MPRHRKRAAQLQGAYGTVRLDSGTNTALKYTRVIDSYCGDDVGNGEERALYVMACNLREAVFMQYLSRVPMEGVIRCMGSSVSATGTLTCKMELGDMTLHDFAKKCNFETRLEHFDTIFKQVTVGLVNMNAHGAVHGDVKCNNIVRVCSDPLTFKLIDFGGIGLRDINVRHVSLCTYVTRAPELFDAEDGEDYVPDELCDAWSLGATMLNYLTRKFIIQDGEDVSALMSDGDIQKWVREQFDAGIVIKIPKRVHPEMAQMIRGLLTVDRGERWTCRRVLQEYFDFPVVVHHVPRRMSCSSDDRQPERIGNPARYGEMVSALRDVVSVREEMQCLPLAVQYVGRYVEHDYDKLYDEMIAHDVLLAAYILARAIVYDEDTDAQTFTDSVRDVMVDMLRKSGLEGLLPMSAGKRVLVSVDGNIGSSKSTVLQAVKKQVSCAVWTEPVADWSEALGLYYTDNARWAMLLHVKILMAYAEMRKIADRVVVAERSAWTCMTVFEDMLLREGKLTPQEHEALVDVALMVDVVPDVIIYLDCDPETCYDRVSERARECENDLDAGYMLRLHDQYKRVMTPENCARYGIKLHVVDAARGRDEIVDDVVKIIKSLW